MLAFRDRDETETLSIFVETRPRRDVGTSRDRLETETSRPRPQPCLSIPLMHWHSWLHDNKGIWPAPIDPNSSLAGLQPNQKWLKKRMPVNWKLNVCKSTLRQVTALLCVTHGEHALHWLTVNSSHQCCNGVFCRHVHKTHIQQLKEVTTSNLIWLSQVHQAYKTNNKHSINGLSSRKTWVSWHQKG